MEIEKQDKEQILLATSSHPLAIYWFQYCNTDDRKKHFDKIRQYYQVLHPYLNSSFTGEENQVEPYLNQESKKYFKTARDEILALYILVFDAWLFVEPALTRVGITDLRSPGELIRRLIDIEASGRFFICCPLVDDLNDHVEFSPRKNAKALVESKKRMGDYRHYLASPDYRESNPDLEKFPMEIFDRLDRYEQFKAWLIMSCIDAASKDDSLMPQINKYLQARKDLWDPMFKAKPKGFSWSKGILKQTRKHGGF